MSGHLVNPMLTGLPCRPDLCVAVAHLFRGTDSASAALLYALMRRSSLSAPARVRALTGIISSRGMLGKNLMTCTGQRYSVFAQLFSQKT